MCVDPFSLLATVGKTVGTTLAGASNALTLASGAFGAISQYQNARVRAQAASINAQNAEDAARDRLRQGEEESDRVRAAAAAARGDRLVAMAANGVDVTSASAIELLGEGDMLAEEDAFAVRETALNQAESGANRAASFRADAATARSESLLSPVRTILGTAAKVGERYQQYLQPEFA